MKVQFASSLAFGGPAAVCLLERAGFDVAAFVLMLTLPLGLVALGGLEGTMSLAASALLCAGLITAVSGLSWGMMYVLSVAVPAVVAVALLRAGRGLAHVVVAAAIATVAGAGLSLWLSGLGWGAFVAEIEALVAESIVQAGAVYRQLGVEVEQLTELESRRAEIAAFFVRLLPALTVVAAGAFWLVHIRLSGSWVFWPQLEGLNRWEAAPWLVWWFIGSGFATLLPHALLSTVAINVFGIMLACYFFQGLAIVSYYFQRLGLPRPLRVASYALIGLQQIVTAVVIALGLFDLWGDFRRLRPVQQTDGETG